MKRKTWLWISGILIVAVAAYFLTRKPQVTEVEVSVASTGDIEEIVSASGSIESETLVKISSDVSGEITDILVKIGDSVIAGQPLVRIRPDNYESAAERAQASLLAQEASAQQAQAAVNQVELRVQKAKNDLARAKNLYNKEVGSEADLQTAQSTYDVALKELDAAKNTAQSARFNVRSAKASLKDAEVTLSKTEILAPLKGTVLNVISKKGERVVGTAQMAGTTIMSLAAINDLQVRVQLNENDVNRIAIGQKVKVHVDAAEDTIFNGIVKNVSNINKEKATNDAVTEYEAVIALPFSLNKSKINLLRIGMTASVDIQTSFKSNVTMAPVQAVMFKTDSSQANSDGSYSDYEFVYLYKQGQAKKQVIKSGIANSANIEIINGLTKGDSVISGPYNVILNQVKENDKVKRKL